MLSLVRRAQNPTNAPLSWTGLPVGGDRDNLMENSVFGGLPIPCISNYAETLLSSGSPSKSTCSYQHQIIFPYHKQPRGCTLQSADHKPAREGISAQTQYHTTGRNTTFGLQLAHIHPTWGRKVTDKLLFFPGRLLSHFLVVSCFKNTVVKHTAFCNLSFSPTLFW